MFSVWVPFSFIQYFLFVENYKFDVLQESRTRLIVSNNVHRLIMSSLEVTSSGSGIVSLIYLRAMHSILPSKGKQKNWNGCILDCSIESLFLDKNWVRDFCCKTGFETILYLCLLFGLGFQDSYTWEELSHNRNICSQEIPAPS